MGRDKHQFEALIIEAGLLGLATASGGNLVKPLLLMAVLVWAAWWLLSLEVELASAACISPLNIGSESELELTTRLILQLATVPGFGALLLLAQIEEKK